MSLTLKYLLETVLPKPVLEIIKRAHYQREIKHSQLTDEPDLAVLPTVIRPDFVCLDVGANVGVFTKHLSGMAKQVFSFEPVPPTFRYLAHNVKALDLKNVTVFQMAVSDRAGTVAMEPGKFNDGRPNFYRSHIIADQGDIPRATIDSLDLPRVDFIKVDVEGHEREVIAGATRTIATSKPIWLIETDLESELFAEMLRCGYTCFVEDSGKLRPRRDREYRINYWFIHRSQRMS